MVGGCGIGISWFVVAVDSINRKALTLKLVMLIVLTTGQRCQTLAYMDISENYMTMNDQYFSFALTDYVKKDRPGSVLGNVALYIYPDKKLCVYETLQPICKKRDFAEARSVC